MALGEQDPVMIASMREELTRHGVQELLTEEEVERLEPTRGTVLLIVTSHDPCSSDLARPGVAMALQHDVLPEKVASVFAGQELEATAKVRSYFEGYFPTAPQIALLKDGAVVHMCDRDHILKTHRSPAKIAEALTRAFDEHCS